MTPEDAEKQLTAAAKDGVESGEFVEIIENLIKAFGQAFQQFFEGIDGFDSAGSSVTGGSGGVSSPDYQGTSANSSEMSMESTLATINDPETQKAVQEFCERYKGNGHLSKDFRNSEYVSFTGSARCMVYNQVLPDFAKLAITYYKKTGKKITITSAYRDIDHQRRLQGGKNPAVKPGNSNHNTGHAIDFGQDVVTGFSGFGVLARACNFTGISSENWHFDHKSKKPAGQTRMAYA